MIKRTDAAITLRVPCMYTLFFFLGASVFSARPFHSLSKDDSQNLTEILLLSFPFCFSMLPLAKENKKKIKQSMT